MAQLCNLIKTTPVQDKTKELSMKISELTGAQLDYWVAMTIGTQATLEDMGGELIVLECPRSL